MNKPFSKFAVFLFFIFLSKWGQFFSQASFTSSPAAINNTLTLCSGSQILFTNTTAGNENTINWIFPGGNPGNANTNGPHIVTFSTPGTYVISLSINGGVASTMQVVIQASSTSSNLNLLLDNACGSGSGSGFGSSTFNNVTYFTSCTNSFQGDNICLYTTTTLTNNNSIHNIFWGDGTSNVYTGSNNPSNQLAFQHYYQNTGASFITYTLQESNNSCVRSKIYPLYTGANPTAVISPGGVPILCNPGSVNYNIIPGTQNTIGTIYTISVNDAGGGSNTSYTFNHPPPASLNHLFSSVSCGTTSVINSNSYQNSFQVSISSSNACGSSSSAIGPINIQSAPDAIVSTTPSLATYNNKVCQGSNVTFNDVSTPGTNINVQGNANTNPPIPPYSCNNIYKKIWRLYGPLGLITMSNAYATILSGSLGTSQSLSSANSWTTGSTNVNIKFLLPGNYKMTLYVGAQNNPCGVDSTETNICVTPDFQVNITSPFVTACAPAIGIFQNNSTPAQCNLNNASAWTVTPSNPENCGPPAWSYTNNTNGQSLNPSISFTGPGVYTVELTNSLSSLVFSNTSPLGCQPKTKTAEITIKAPPVITLPPTFSFCENASFNPSATVNNCYGIAPLTFAWNFNPNNDIPFNSQPNPLLSNNPNPGIIYPQVGGPFPFTVSVTNECGTTIANSTITITAEASASISYVGSPFCTSITTPQSVTQAGTTGGSYSSSTGLNINASTGAITPSLSIPGIYTVTYTVAASAGCVAVSTTASVTITAAPTATIIYAGPFCNTFTSPQSVTLTGTGAYTGGAYSASPTGLNIDASTGAITPSTSNAGTYTVTYTIPASGGCAIVPVTTTVIITAPPIQPTISYAGSPFCKTLTTGQAVTQTGATGGLYTAAPNGLTINTADGNITPSSSTADTYTVTYTVAAAGGCAEVAASTTVTINAVPSFLNTSISICSDLPIGFTFPSNPTPAVASWNIIDTIMQLGLIPAGTNFQIAQNGSITTTNLSAIANDSFTNTTNTSKTVTFKVIPLGSNGCLGDTFNIVVTVLPEPFHINTNLNDWCSNLPIDQAFPNSIPTSVPSAWYYINSITLTGANVVSGSLGISSPPIQLNNPTLRPAGNVNNIYVATGSGNGSVTYLVTPLSAAGCIGTPFLMTVQIIPSTIQMLNADTVIICSGESVDLNLQSNTLSLAPIWNCITTTSTLQTPSYAPQDTSRIIDILVNPESYTQEIKYVVNFINTSIDPLCPGQSDTIHVFVLPEPTITPIDDIVLCHDETINSIPVNINIGTINWFHTGDDIGLPYISNTTLLSPNEIPGFTSINNGTSIETLIVHLLPSYTDIILPSNISKTCNGIEELVQITVNPIPSLNPLPDSIILCPSVSSNNIQPSGPIIGSYYTWVNNWSNSNSSISLAPNGTGNIPTFFGINNNSNAVESEIVVTPTFTTNSTSCYGENATIIVKIRPMPNVLNNVTIICSGENTNITLQSDSPSSFEWYADPNMTVLNETSSPIQTSINILDNLTLLGSVQGTVQYHVIPTSIPTFYPFGCEGPETIISVNVNPLPIVDFIALNPPYCDLNPISFQNLSNGVYDFNWDFGDGSANSYLTNPTHQFPSIGSFDVQLNAENDITGCSDSIITPIIISPSPDANFTYSDSSACDFLDVTYIASSANPNWNYLWDFGNGETVEQIGSIGYQFDEAGCYDVSLTVTNNQGCSNTDTLFNIACVFESPTAIFNADPINQSVVEPLVNFYNFSQNATSYEWNFGDGTYSFAENTNHSYPYESIDYLVVLTAFNEVGCSDTAAIYIHVGFILYVPNSFTPNDDERNQDFLPIITAGYKLGTYRLNIYNRWGENVFESYDPNFGWNGTYGQSGIDCEIGTYTYVIELEVLQNQEIKKFIGHVNLIR